MNDRTTEYVQAVVDAASRAAPAWAAATADERSRVLHAVADALDTAREELVEIAGRETHLPEGRLNGELTRTTFQLRLLGQEVAEGRVLGARVDEADPDWPMGAPRPDLRRVNVPLGPVVVFAASNFPFAFSVLGGDTAAALAAGCPVVLKAHPGHPELSRRTAAVAVAAIRTSGGPDGLLGLIEGQDEGVRALQHPAVAAGAFTGSIAGGRALFDIASSRPTPIPFFAEMGSVNPVVVLSEAVDDELVTGFIASFTMGVGQFCTKPGLLVVPSGSGVVERLSAASLPSAAPMLNQHIADGFRSSLAALAASPVVDVVAGSVEQGDGLDASPVLLRTTAKAVLDDHSLAEECFGPAALVVEHDGPEQALELVRSLDGQLTASIWGDDDSDAASLLGALVGRAGRVLWNQWPTGVSVTHAQQHGGPYPATTAPWTTSVGTAAIERFVRPVAFQNVPQHLLPMAVRDGQTDARQRRS